jgi:hypothetical protein
MKKTWKFIFFALVILCAAAYLTHSYWENRLLKKIIERLSADSRVAEVLVTDVRPDLVSGKNLTTIKFLEYDTSLRPLAPKYFTFSEEIIQFQAMVIRFDDFYVRSGHPLKGKSAYIFTKVFALNDGGAESFALNRVNEVPSGYAIEGVRNPYQGRLWKKFWQYALDPRQAKRVGIKNAQIEAPGTRFVPGLLYTIKIEHAGGLRIEARPLPPILEGEKIKF